MCVYVVCVHVCMRVCVYELFSFQVLQIDREEVQVQFLKKRGEKLFQNWMFLGFCQKLHASAEPSAPMANTFSVTNCTENEAKEAKLKKQLKNVSHF